MVVIVDVPALTIVTVLPLVVATDVEPLVKVHAPLPLEVGAVRKKAGSPKVFVTGGIVIVRLVLNDFSLP